MVRFGDADGDVATFWGDGAAEAGVRWAVDRSHASGRQAQLWAHYGGGFDARFVLPALLAPIEEGGAETGDVLDVGSTVLRCWGRMVDGARFDLRDSIRLLPGSLARIGEEMGLRKLGASFKHRRGRCRCVACLYESDRPALQRYCSRDTLILWRALAWAERLLAGIGVDRMRLTLASCAAASVLGPLAEDERPYTPHGEAASDPWDALLDGDDAQIVVADVDRDAEDAACGGRTEGFRRRLARGRLYDRRASYPAAMAEGPLPWRYLGPGGDWRPDDPGERAIVWADVEVPEGLRFPVLPWRDRRGKLLFPAGRWRGAFYGEELAYAEAVGAAEVGRVWRVERWATSDRLGDWARELWARIADAKGFERYFWKILRNAAYGKFLQRREQRRYVFRPPDAEGLCRVHDRLPLWYRDTSYQPRSRNVVTGAAITARARVALHRAMALAEARGGRVAYVDTDSVLTSGTLPVGPGLGEWALQDRVTDVEVLAPKLYRYRVDGEPVVKAKGIRGLSWKGFDRLAAGEAAPFERGRGWKESIKAGSVEYERLRVSRRWLMGARPKRAPDGRGGSRPWIVDGDDYAEGWEAAT